MLYSQASGIRQNSASHRVTSPHRATKRQKGKCIKEQTAHEEKSQNKSLKQDTFYLGKACLVLLQKADFYINLQY